MKYFTFNWIQYSDGQMIKSGDSFYYTNADVNIDEMKNIVRTTALNNPAAVITIQNVQPISKEFYDMKTVEILAVK